ncbi:MAG: DUF1552 domain-containing protein [Opitutaceae bacterium]
MILTKKSLSRRTFLKGVGASISLPLLDSMVAAATPLAKTAAAPVKRLGYVFMPMGCDQSRWTPSDISGKLSDMSPILRSLDSVKGDINVLTNMELRLAYPGSHATSNSAFLSAARAKQTESNDYYLGTTADQIAAKAIGQGTRLPSLELAMDLQENVGQCDNGYACVYQNNLSWSTPTTPLPSEAHPRVVFERLFGEWNTEEERAAAIRRRASLLDSVLVSIKSLKRDLGATDSAKIDDYLDSIREVERRIQLAEANIKDNPTPDIDRPMGVPDVYSEHARLMFDLQVLALQGDITRVSTFQLARETSNRVYTETGVMDPHHPLSHHGNDPDKIARLAKINEFHVSLFAEYLEKLKAIPEGAGNLLDHSLILYGSGIGNPNRHDHSNLPTIIAGGAAGNMKTGRHIRYAEQTPLANLHLTMLNKVGVDIDKFGDSKGLVNELLDV